MTRRSFALIVLVLALVTTHASAYPRPGRTFRANVSSSGATADAASYTPGISADGRFVAFHSAAENLTTTGSGGKVQVVLRDTALGTTELISIGADGAPGNGHSFPVQVWPPWPAPPVITPDGRFVAFSSSASNLVPGDTNATWDVFIRDRETATTERISVAADGSQSTSWSGGPSISDDGRLVAFYSKAVLGPGDPSSFWSDIYLRDRAEGTTRVLSGGSTPINTFDSFDPSISGDGSVVAFLSGSIHTESDTNGFPDIYLRDLTTDALERISVASDGAGASSASWSPRVSRDGRFVAFGSAATNLTPRHGKGGGGLPSDAYVRDRVAGTTERVSVSSAGEESNGHAGLNSVSQNYNGAVQISADGRVIAYGAWASNLTEGDANQISDAYLYDRLTGATERLSLTDAGAGSEMGMTFFSLAADGRHVAMQIDGGAVVAGDPGPGIFVRDAGPAVGVLDVRTESVGETVDASGEATFRGTVLTSAIDPADDVASAGADLRSARIALRPEREDLLVRLDLAAPVRPAGLPGLPGIGYGMRFSIQGTRFEVRIDGTDALRGTEVSPQVSLWTCDTVCSSVANLRGALGISGWEARASVPLSLLPAGPLTQIEAYAGAGASLSGSAADLDTISLADAPIPAPTVTVTLGETTVTAPLVQGRFAASLPSAPGPILVRACLGAECGEINA